MKRLLPLTNLVLFLLLSLVSFSQKAPTIQWQKSFGGSLNDEGRCMDRSPDDGFMIAASSKSNDINAVGNHGDFDILLVKTDSTGAIEWRKCLGGTKSDIPSDIRYTADGGYILCGRTTSYSGDVAGNTDTSFANIWVVKMSSTGVIEWQRCFGGTGYDRAEKIKQTADGGYILLATTWSDNGGILGHHGTNSSSDVWLAKLDTTGAIVWQNSYGGTSYDSGTDLIIDATGDYIIGASRGSTDGDLAVHSMNIEKSAWVFKVSPTGTIKSSYVYGGSGSDGLQTITPLPNKGLLVTLQSGSNDGDLSGMHGYTDACLIKTDSLGNVQKSKCFGGSEEEECLVMATPDGNFLIYGLTVSPNDGDVTGNHGGSDGWIAKVDTGLNLKWQQSLGGTGDEYFYQAIPSGNSYYLLGYSDSNNGDVTTNLGNTDAWFIKMNPDTSTHRPLISSISNTSGAIGSVVTINGSDFSAMPADNIVYFGAVRATVAAASATQLTVTVPAGATYQPITVNINGYTAFSEERFAITTGAAAVTANSFASSISYPVWGITNEPFIGDFDGDGKADIALLNEKSGDYRLSNFVIFKNNSSPGNYQLDSVAGIRTAHYPLGGTIGDVDGDGKLDIIACSPNVDSFAIHLNTTSGGAISFTPAINTALDGARMASIRDLNLDGKSDIALSLSRLNTFPIPSVYKNNSTPGTVALSASATLPYSAGHIATADLDGDSRPEIIHTNYDSAQLYIYRNTGSSGSFSFSAPIKLAAAAGAINPMIGDIDGDGKVDIVVNNEDAAKVIVYRNVSTTGSLSFLRTDISTFLIADTSKPISGNEMKIGDLNGDGRPEIVVTHTDSNAVVVYQNTSTPGNVSFAGGLLYHTDSIPFSLAIADIDNDGKNEIIVNNISSLEILKNKVGLLPVKLLSFTGKKEGTSAVLQWKTAEEKNILHFVIERSVNGGRFDSLAKIKAGGSNLNSSYELVDKLDNAPVYFYRLRMVDKDGSFTYSNVVAVRTVQTEGFTVYPNPASDRVVVKHPHSTRGSINIIDQQGRIVKSIGVSKGAEQTIISIKNIARGTYTMVFSDDSNGRYTETLIIR